MRTESRSVVAGGWGGGRVTAYEDRRSSNLLNLDWVVVEEKGGQLEEFFFAMPPKYCHGRYCLNSAL